MSLLRLLAAGKSLVGMSDAETRYRVTSQRLLPSSARGEIHLAAGEKRGQPKWGQALRRITDQRACRKKCAAPRLCARSPRRHLDAGRRGWQRPPVAALGGLGRCYSAGQRRSWRGGR